MIDRMNERAAFEAEPARLTDEQIYALQEEYDCFGTCDAPRIHDFARAIERACAAHADKRNSEPRACAAQPSVNWRPFGLTVESALNRGDDPSLLFDENS